MDIKNKTKMTQEESKAADVAIEELDFKGKTQIKCPRCGGSWLFKFYGTSASSIECENKCGVKKTYRGI